jgi:hypothetical protein
LLCHRGGGTLAVRDPELGLANHPTVKLDGPRAALQMLSNGHEEFASYGDFIKGESTLDVISKMFGRAGDGYQYHHIVTQGGANEDNISPEQLQNTDNIIRLPTLLHEAVNAEYLKPAPSDPNVTFYDWLQQQPYEVQYEEGLKILRTLHILD